MKKFVLLIIIFFLGMIFINFGGNGDGSKGLNINKKLSGRDKPTFMIPKANNKIYNQQSVLVKFRQGMSKIQKNSLLELVGAKFKDKNNDGIDDRYRSILGGRLALLEFDGKRRTDHASAALAVLKQHPNVEYAEYNYRQYVNVIPSDPFFSSQWGMNNTGQTGGTLNADIDAPEAWDISTGNSEVIVGLIDTGVCYTHEDLADNIWINPREIPGNGVDDDGNGYIDDIHGINAIIENGDPWDDNSHGTHCAGIIGAVGNNNKGVAGVDWTVKIIGLKFLDSQGYGWVSDAVECIDYAVWLKKHGVSIRVLNNSWGGGGYSQSLADAISEANNAGILFTAAAGNDFNDNDINPDYPACYPNVLAVASTDSNDGLSWFSNYGATTVHLGAPGSEILSTVLDNSYDSYTGTSMAAPQVSGAAALLLSLNDRLTVLDLKDYLMNYGDPLPVLNGKTVSGKRLNLYNSLNQVPALDPTFSLSATPVFQVIEQGQKVSYTIGIQSVLRFSRHVNLSAAARPAIVGNIAFTPNP
ncbi:MAG TPA: S8 family peptidase, partial [Candidatus Deferrimicrobium sp.]|nr:S8 family peptidase [Candidatus Deferrimicrobium sp.]